jgi:putative glutamine amidotransferase
MKPVIGITCFVREATYGNWTRDAAILPSAYITMVSKAGGVPLIIPPAGDMTLLLDAMDGLIVAGGPDISPASYGEQPGPMTTEFYPDQDFSEMGLIKEAINRDMPLLGICRGMQILSVSHGGKMHQHLGVSDAGSLDISARAEHDGLIEGVERRDKKFCIGVQWHPERKGHDLLFSGLIEAARG